MLRESIFVERSMPDVAEILGKAPHDPGCYLMKGKDGRIFYIGKAKDLLARMRQYIPPASDTRPFVKLLPEILYSVDFILTASEKEALILESNLIRKHKPRYNIRIKDDRSYFMIRLDTSRDFPKIQIVRARVAKGKGLFFGPYASAGKAREVVRLVNKHFKIRTCTDRAFAAARRPCVRHQMNRCLGPCCLPVDRETYHAEIQRVRLFLEGRKDLLVEDLTRLMREAASEQRFEDAARYRDSIRAVEATLEKQYAQMPKANNWDVLGFHREGSEACVLFSHFRSGALTGQSALMASGEEREDGELLHYAMVRHYERTKFMPAAILLPFEVVSPEPLEQWLWDLAGHRVAISVPLRGFKRKLVDNAATNAARNFEEKVNRERGNQAILEKIQRKLRLTKFPERIECYDISNIQGRMAVGSGVCFIHGVAEKSEYRRYRIKTLDSPDDYGMMREVLSRRFKRGLEEGDLPDLLVLDGGKGQLKIAETVLNQLGVEDVELASLAKSRLKDHVGEGEIAEDWEGSKRTPERVFRPGVKMPILFKPGTGELFLFQRIRDEAHRFAITYHRKLRKKEGLRSSLLEIPGVGATRMKLLLRHFGSLKRVRAASIEELAAVEGIPEGLAERIREYFDH